MFNWQIFLDQHNVPYADRGRNISKGNLALQCPWCGEADAGQHMNVNLQGRGWACWRNADHRGRNPTRLVQALLQCSWAEANELTGGKDITATDDILVTLLAQLKGGKPIKRGIQLPPTLMPITKRIDTMAHKLVFQYLASRGYSPPDVERLAKRYGMLYAVVGDWRKRAVWPLYDEHGTLQNVTGRAIGSIQPRYKTISHDNAGAPISECLFDAPRLFNVKEGNALVVCEGPMDAKRVTWIGEAFGVYATCVFTQNVSEVQAAMIQRLAYRFDRVFVLFDHGAQLHAFRAYRAIGGDCQVAALPANVKDPGELSPMQALDLVRSLAG